ncbi:MAG: hypothetical protein U0325_11710 [Polyangiales bacterium]
MLRALLLALLVLAGCERRQHERVRHFVPDNTLVDVTPSLDDRSIVHSNRLGSVTTGKSLLAAFWLPSGLVLIFAALWTSVHRRRAAREAQAAEKAPLRNGPAVIHGRVETDGGDAITVTVTQRRRVVKGKNGTYTYWDEKRRDLDARPFRVISEAGRVVQVIPDARVHLRDALESPETVDAQTRRRRIRLRPGELVWVSGVLSGVREETNAGAYREAPQEPVVRRGLGAMVVSTEPPGAYHAARAAEHRGWIKATLYILALLHGTLLIDVTAQILSGHGVEARIDRTATWDVWVKPKNSPGRWVRHCAVWAAADGEASQEYEVACGFHACAERGQCRTLPTVRALLTADRARDPGRGPTMHSAQLGFGALVTWASLLVYWISVRSSRPWYAGGKVNDGS